MNNFLFLKHFGKGKITYFCEESLKIWQIPTENCWSRQYHQAVSAQIFLLQKCRQLLIQCHFQKIKITPSIVVINDDYLSEAFTFTHRVKIEDVTQSPDIPTKQLLPQVPGIPFWSGPPVRFPVSAFSSLTLVLFLRTNYTC